MAMAEYICPTCGLPLRFRGHTQCWEIERKREETAEALAAAYRALARRRFALAAEPTHG